MVNVNRWEWQAPPDWPVPPPGWSPYPGWQPDRFWPAAPEGWNWWHRVPGTPRQRLGFGLLIGGSAAAVATVVAVFGVLIAVQIVEDRTGCGSIDPTDPANYSQVIILNDTAGAVTLDDCPGAYCHADELPVRLAPGHRFHDNAGCAATGLDMTSWRVTRGNGTLLGYVAVETPRKHDGLVFRVSRVSPDRRTPTPSG